MKKQSGKFFSKSLFAQSIKNTFPLALCCLIVFVMINISFVLFAFEPKGEFLIADILILPIAVILSSSAFSFITKRKECDFYHALPQKRTCVFVSLLASVLTWIVLIVLVATVANIIGVTIAGLSINILQSLFASFGVILTGFSIVGVSVICKLLSGNDISYAFYAVAAIVSPRILVPMFVNTIYYANDSVLTSNIKINFFTAENTPLFYFYATGSEGSALIKFDSPWQIIGTILFAIIEAALLFAFGAFLYNKRKSEYADKNIPYKKTHAFFRTLAALPLIIYAIVYYNEEYKDELFLFFALSLAIHFSLDFIITKKLVKAAKSLPMFLVTLAVSALFMGGAYGVNEIYIKSTPDADEIASITITPYESVVDSYHAVYGFNNEWVKYDLDLYFVDEEGNVHCRDEREKDYLTTDDKEAINAVCEDFEHTISANRCDDENEHIYKYSYLITMNLKSGKKVVRKIKFSEENYITLFAAMRSEEAYKEKFELPKWDTLTLADIKLLDKDIDKEDNFFFDFTEELYTTFVKEYNALTAKEQVEIEIYQFHESRDSWVELWQGDTPKILFPTSEKFPETFSLAHEIFESLSQSK